LVNSFSSSMRWEDGGRHRSRSGTCPVCVLPSPSRALCRWLTHLLFVLEFPCASLLVLRLSVPRLVFPLRPSLRPCDSYSDNDTDTDTDIGKSPSAFGAGNLPSRSALSPDRLMVASHHRYDHEKSPAATSTNLTPELGLHLHGVNSQKSVTSASHAIFPCTAPCRRAPARGRGQNPSPGPFSDPHALPLYCSVPKSSLGMNAVQSNFSRRAHFSPLLLVGRVLVTLSASLFISHYL
jgi:hypothetical protein